MKDLSGAIIIAFVILLGFYTLYLSIPEENMYHRRADEGCYHYYASKIASDGFLPATRRLISDYLQKPEQQFRPIPLRIGFTGIAAVWLAIFPATFKSLAGLSFLCFALTVLLTLFYSSKFFGRERGLLIACLMTFSPLGRAMAIRALSDSTSFLFISLSVWLFLDYTSQKSTRGAIVFASTYTIALLIRESSLALFPFFALFALIDRYRFGVKIGKDALAAIMAPPLIAGAALLCAAGGAGRLLDTARIAFAAPAANAYSVLYCRGPWFRILVDYMILSACTSFMAIGYAFSTIARNGIERRDAFFLLLFICLFVFLALPDYGKNVRYALPLDMIFRIFAVLMLERIFERRGFRKSLVLIATLFVCYIDFNSFELLFIQNAIYDPISQLLFTATRFIPQTVMH